MGPNLLAPQVHLGHSAQGQIAALTAYLSYGASPSLLLPPEGHSFDEAGQSTERDHALFSDDRQAYDHSQDGRKA